MEAEIIKSMLDDCVILELSAKDLTPENSRPVLQEIHRLQNRLENLLTTKTTTPTRDEMKRHRANRDFEYKDWENFL